MKKTRSKKSRDTVPLSTLLILKLSLIQKRLGNREKKNPRGKKRHLRLIQREVIRRMQRHAERKKKAISTAMEKGRKARNENSSLRNHGYFSEESGASAENDSSENNDSNRLVRGSGGAGRIPWASTKGTGISVWVFQSSPRRGGSARRPPTVTLYSARTFTRRIVSDIAANNGLSWVIETGPS